MMEAKCFQNGFNLIELMAVLAVTAIILSVGVPQLSSTIERNNISAEANRLAASINFARSQSVNKQLVVTLERKGSTANDWTEGWTIYSDAGSEGNEAINTGNNAANDVFLKDMVVDTSGLSIIADAITDQWVSFLPSGRLLGGPVSIALCNSDYSDGITGILISINSVGRITRTTIAAADKADDCEP